jgi:outer membrane protein assembly factor BamB
MSTAGSFIVFVAAMLAALGCSGPPSPPPVAPPRAVRHPVANDIIVNENTHQVTKHDTTGASVWSTHLDGDFRNGREPNVVSDLTRVYVAHNDGVTALDMGTGSILWHSAGSGDRMLLSGDLVLATECSCGDLGKMGRRMIARDTATGNDVFSVILPLNDFDPEPIEEVAGYFLVQAEIKFGPDGLALLVDRDGRVRFRSKSRVLGVLQRDNDHIVFTAKAIVGLAPDDAIKWSSPIEYGDWLSYGGLLPVANGNIIAFEYGPISDSGVSLRCIDAGTGALVWKSYCNHLGVSHSIYRHEATVEQLGDQLRVTSRGSFGTFVEMLDAATGRQNSRQVSE